MARLTLKDIEAMDEEMLSPALVAPIIGCDQQTLRMQARERPDLLGFPTICLGSRVRIPKEGFLAYCRGQLGTRGACG